MAGAGAPRHHPDGLSKHAPGNTQHKLPPYVLNGIPDFLHVFDRDGLIRYASPICRHLTGFEPTDLLGRSILDLIHPDDSELFIKEISYSQALHKSVRFIYRFRKTNNQWVIFDSQIQWHSGTRSAQHPFLENKIDAPGYFVMARPYQTQSTTLLDSFLEHKIEHERLVRRVAELRREEEDELATEEEELRLSQENELAKENDGGHCDKKIKLEQDDKATLPCRYPEPCKSIKRRKKKMRALPRCHICIICGTTESPEWRKGPEGPKTLCNACGCK
jgi:hypothetical protein